MGVRERTAWAPSWANPPDVRAVPDDRSNYTSDSPDCQPFSEDFSQKIEKSKTKPAQNIFPFCVGMFSSSCRCRPGSIFRHWFTCFLLPRISFHYLIFLQANAIISMELHFRCWAGCTAWYAKRFMVRWKYDKGLFGQSSWLETLLKNQKIMIWWAW